MRSWDVAVRERFLACVAELFDRQFPYGVVQTDLHDLTVGTKTGGGDT